MRMISDTVARSVMRIFHSITVQTLQTTKDLLRGDSHVLTRTLRVINLGQPAYS